ncbi:MAG: hypothetical protein LC689_09600, partial [Myxococcales bacterium]|nr:hypothetical protein [Myxococcales bacterium]
MKTLLAAVGLAALCACAHGPPAPDPELVNWQSRHPVAARELCSFSRDYPSETSRLRRWMHDHPVQAQQMMDWATMNPGLMAPPPFLRQMPPEFDGYRPWRDPALYSLFDWA